MDYKFQELSSLSYIVIRMHITTPMHVSIAFRTQRAVTLPDKEQAVSGQDYVAQQSTVDMRDGITRVPVEITVLAVSPHNKRVYYL